MAFEQLAEGLRLKAGAGGGQKTWEDRLRRALSGSPELAAPPLPAQGHPLRTSCRPRAGATRPTPRAGEDIRILDTSEHALPDAELGQDFWVLDDTHVVLMRYDDQGAIRRRRDRAASYDTDLRDSP